MSATEQPTCGKGLAENSVLPAKLAEIIAAMAANLEIHMQALDQTDEDSRKEYQVYESLVNQLHQASAHLQATAAQMAGARDLPMGRHDEESMTHPRIYAVFKTFVTRKQELLTLLEQMSARDDELLQMMRGHTR